MAGKLPVLNEVDTLSSNNMHKEITVAPGVRKIKIYVEVPPIRICDMALSKIRDTPKPIVEVPSRAFPLFPPNIFSNSLTRSTGKV